MNTTTTKTLYPRDGRKSFRGKAYVEVKSNGDETLYSYDTAILTRHADGTLQRHWRGWSATTQRHIAAFCGMNKAQYKALPV